MSQTMKIGYMGSPQISAALLESLIGIHDIRFVLSNPDKTRGRSGALQPTPVSRLALDRGLPLFRFDSLKSTEVASQLKAFDCDVFLIFAYGKLIPRDIFKGPRFETLNLHASLLPKLRGASPIQSAILQGYQTTGWTVQQITEELDAGDILSSREIEIGPNLTAGDLTDLLLPLGIDLVHETLANLETSILKKRRQEGSEATFCSKLSTAQSWIDWQDSRESIHRQVMGLNPAPVARSLLDGKILKVYRTALTENRLKPGPAGQIVVETDGKHKRMFVLTGDLPLEILELQIEGKNKVDARAFLNGAQVNGKILVRGQKQ